MWLKADSNPRPIPSESAVRRHQPGEGVLLYTAASRRPNRLGGTDVPVPQLLNIPVPQLLNMPVPQLLNIPVPHMLNMPVPQLLNMPSMAGCFGLQVCLSLLGTWSGPGWDPKSSNVLQVFFVLLLVLLPFFMCFFGGGGGASGRRQLLAGL